MMKILEKYNLNNYETRDLIKATKDNNYIKSIIENEKRLKELEINEHEKFNSILAMEDIAI